MESVNLHNCTHDDHLMKDDFADMNDQGPLHGSSEPRVGNRARIHDHVIVRE
jgi:hypothetical protein